MRKSDPTAYVGFVIASQIYSQLQRGEETAVRQVGTRVRNALRKHFPRTNWPWVNLAEYDFGPKAHFTIDGNKIFLTGQPLADPDDYLPSGVAAPLVVPSPPQPVAITDNGAPTCDCLARGNVCRDHDILPDDGG
ncbi:hypothetical protein HJC99_05655 [Candidatus Saccharibacteria bacterium]|nr:hypothetical protein [Candidatus Saccharibacteria bacterium]